jgi:hypothetical protein
MYARLTLIVLFCALYEEPRVTAMDIMLNWHKQASLYNAYLRVSKNTWAKLYITANLFGAWNHCSPSTHYIPESLPVERFSLCCTKAGWQPTKSNMHASAVNLNYHSLRRNTLISTEFELPAVPLHFNRKIIRTNVHDFREIELYFNKVLCNYYGGLNASFKQEKHSVLQHLVNNYELLYFGEKLYTDQVQMFKAVTFLPDLESKKYRFDLDELDSSISLVIPTYQEPQEQSKTERNSEFAFERLVKRLCRLIVSERDRIFVEHSPTLDSLQLYAFDETGPINLLFSTTRDITISSNGDRIWPKQF